MKIRYTYTVVREYNNNDSIDDELDSLKRIKDKPGRYLYGVTRANEWISVNLEFFIEGEWVSSSEVENGKKKTKHFEGVSGC